MSFVKFGQIVAINTAVSILFPLTVTIAMLACVAPIHFSRTTDAGHTGHVGGCSLGSKSVLGGRTDEIIRLAVSQHTDLTMGQFKLMSVRGAPLHINVTAISTRLLSKQGRWVWISK